jgi:glycosyltransferase involved in cell wall biosynthesis
MVIVLLPAYNEEASLSRLMPKLREVFERQGEAYRIIACNDGSRDGTRGVLQSMVDEYPLEVITHRSTEGSEKPRATCSSGPRSLRVQAMSSFDWIVTTHTNPSSHRG